MKVVKFTMTNITSKTIAVDAVIAGTGLTKADKIVG